MSTLIAAMSPTLHTIRLSTKQRSAIIEALNHRITQLRAAPGDLKPAHAKHMYRSYVHGGDDKYKEITILRRLLQTGVSPSLPYTLSLYESEWPAFSRALRSHPRGTAFYQRLTQMRFEGAETFPFTADKAARSRERRQMRVLRGRGRPRKTEAGVT